MERIKIKDATVGATYRSPYGRKVRYEGRDAKSQQCKIFNFATTNTLSVAEDYELVLIDEDAQKDLAGLEKMVWETQSELRKAKSQILNLIEDKKGLEQKLRAIEHPGEVVRKTLTKKEEKKEVINVSIPVIDETGAVVMTTRELQEEPAQIHVIGQNAPIEVIPSQEETMTDEVKAKVPSEGAARSKLIRELLAAGKSDEDITKETVAAFPGTKPGQVKMALTMLRKAKK